MSRPIKWILRPPRRNTPTRHSATLTGGTLIMISTAMDQRVYQMTMSKGDPRYDVSPRHVLFAQKGTELKISPLLEGIRTLSGEKIQWYLASELRERIRNARVCITVVDKLARARFNGPFTTRCSRCRTRNMMGLTPVGSSARFHVSTVKFVESDDHLGSHSCRHRSYSTASPLHWMPTPICPCCGRSAKSPACLEPSLVAAWRYAVHARFTWTARRSVRASCHCRQSPVDKSPRSRASRASQQRRFKRPGSSFRCRNAATANPGKSCPQLHSLKRMQRRRTPISMAP